MRGFLEVLLICCLFCCSCWDLVRCALFFPTNSAYGIFAAIAVPLDLPHRNVFVSYNFEANYNLPATWSIPPYATGIEDEDLLEQARHIELPNCSNCTTNTNSTLDSMTDDDTETASTEEPSLHNATAGNSRRRRSLLTRAHFYHILKDKFKRSGYNAEPCLLRLICETNASGLGEVNGLLGTLIHIIFSPSTSSNEDLPLPYYQAEWDGTHDLCAHYTVECEENILDLISAPLGDILNSLTSNQ